MLSRCGNIIVILLLTIVGGCSHLNDPTWNDTRIIRIVNEFRDEMSKRGVEVEIGDLQINLVEDVGGRLYGECYRYRKPKLILLEYSLLTKIYFRKGMYHELGHCMLGLDHDETNSIMKEVVDYELVTEKDIDNLVNLYYKQLKLQK